jgi:Cu/Ag efflux pump CusA
MSESGVKDPEKSIEKVRTEYAKIPGVAANLGGFISHRLDEVLFGVRSAIAVKIFGPDLQELRAIGKEVETAMKDISGVVDLQLEPQVPIKQIQIQFDRTAAARYGLAVGDLAETIETALNGKTVSQVLEQQQVFDLVVWMKESDRSNLDIIRHLLAGLKQFLSPN